MSQPLLPLEFSWMENETQEIARTIIDPREKELFILDTLHMLNATKQPITESRLIYPKTPKKKEVGHSKA
jgi:hypothetical protein